MPCGPLDHLSQTPAPDIHLLPKTPLRWLQNPTQLSLPNSRLQDLENQYRKEKEEADLLLEQQRLVRGRLEGAVRRAEARDGLVGA